MQALAIVVGLVEFDVLRGRRRSEVINVDMSQPAQLGLDSAEHSVIRVARVTRFVSRYSMILKMRRSQVLRVVNMQALSVRLHDVTRKTEFSALCVIQFAGSSHSKAEKGQREQRQKRCHFPAAR